ncbi:hypothetical protein Efla_003920 [Eimeria flavescens]
MQPKEPSFPRRPSATKELRWDDVFRNVISRDFRGNERVDSGGETGGFKPPPKLAAETESSKVTYVKLQSSKDLAILASSSDEAIQAVKTLANALAHRSRFIGCYRTPNGSPAVRLVDEGHLAAGSSPGSSGNPQVSGISTDEAYSQRPQDGASREPHFDPLSVEPPPPCGAQCRFIEGIMNIYWHLGAEMADPPLLWEAEAIPTVSEYLAALQDVMIAVQDPACKTFCYGRIKFLEGKFNFHLMFNSNAEVEETKRNKHRDFYNVRKVDTHVHHSACMHQKHLLRFIRKKYRTEGNTVVAIEGGQGVTLRDLFQKELGFSAREASVDHLNVHALGSCFQRFDLFNQKYNPFGQARLRDVFLKTDNHIKGRFLAELTKEVIADLDDRKYQHAEWRVSIYGRCPGEWERLAAWVVDNGLHSRRVRWMIQVPRLYHVYRQRGVVPSFGKMLRNVFEPLFEAVKNPQKHRKIFLFLQTMVGFDSVDDESRVSKYTMEGGDLPHPDEWTSVHNPPYSYWAFYMYANIRALNLFLEARNMRTLSFRRAAHSRFLSSNSNCLLPHCGEAGSASHLAAAFLLADGINHGILLKGAPVLQYMFFLKQIGIAVSPLSNNALFVDIAKNPLYSFFKTGLNVSLSTDDPLMFHFTDEPLLEEYSIAAHVWKLSPVDLCELARNSVLQSGFENEFKRHWLGDRFWLPGAAGNDMRRTNVSNIRLQYRFDTWRDELEYMREILSMRMALTANQQQPSLLSAGGSSSHSLSVDAACQPEAPAAIVCLDAGISSAAEETEKHQHLLAPEPLGQISTGNSEALSPSVGPSNPHSVLSSPGCVAESFEESHRRRCLTEQELNELTCAAHQLTLSMPPPQSEETDS